MNEQQKAVLDRKLKLQRGAAIIEGTQDQFRQDGYTNMLNKYGTKQDNSTAYQYTQEEFTSDLELIRLYEGNGLFTKIIDRPAEEAVKHGFDIDYGDKEISEYVEEKMDSLELEDRFATAEKWARLYGGSIIVMLVDDGRGLEEPLDWNNVRSIEELRVFERAIVQPDYTALYNFHFMDSMEKNIPFGEPEYYQVFSIYGYFMVHRSRCLVFRNGRLPEQTTNALYRYWGIPEYVRIKNALRECITSHQNGPKLLERCVQAIYKMKNLANMLSTEDGENKVLQRLQVIDMARNILNSIAIDSDGEDYDFKSFSMSGVKEIIDSTCNMLSAVTNIPQTILFGRSPAGMNSTGDADFENYYNMVENIQKQNMKANARTVIDLILKQGVLEGKIQEAPRYKVKFASLWSMSETEKADVESKQASTEYTKAQTAQIYMESNVLDPTEVRKTLESDGQFEIMDPVTEDDLNLPDDTFDFGNSTIKENNDSINDEDYPAVAVLVVKDGKILCASRNNNEGLCGPGGHVEDGETLEEAVIREAMEEFNIVPLNLLPLGEYKGNTDLYLPSKIYLTDHFAGIPRADGIEMLNEQWLSLEELEEEYLFPPFGESLKMLEELLENSLTNTDSVATINIKENKDGGPGSGRYPKGSGKKGEKESSNTENSGIAYAGKKISSYIANPKLLGESTHKEKYDDFVSKGVDVKPLGKGSHKGVSYEQGGGYRVNGTEDGQYMQYHPSSKSHHNGEYYKLSSGKTGRKRYDMDGNPIDE